MIVYLLIIVLLAGLAWEIKDGLMDYHVYGWFGGDGFSWRDLVADAVGIIIALIFKGMMT